LLPFLFDYKGEPRKNIFLTTIIFFDANNKGLSGSMIERNVAGQTNNSGVLWV